MEIFGQLWLDRTRHVIYLESAAKAGCYGNTSITYFK